MSAQYDATPRTGNDSTGIALSSAAGLGGTIGVRVTIDDALITSKADALRTLQSLKNEIQRRDWPATAGATVFNALLLESGGTDYLLLESGDPILLEA